MKLNTLIVRKLSILSLAILFITVSFAFSARKINYNSNCGFYYKNAKTEKKCTENSFKPLNLIPCQWCKKQYNAKSTRWLICNKCNFRICVHCLSKHEDSKGNRKGFKCTQCSYGKLEYNS